MCPLVWQDASSDDNLVEGTKVTNYAIATISLALAFWIFYICSCLYDRFGMGEFQRVSQILECISFSIHSSRLMFYIENEITLRVPLKIWI